MSTLTLSVVASALVGFIGTFFFTRIVCQNARHWGLLDAPTEERKIHTRAMPTGGGLAIAGGVAIGAVVLFTLYRSTLSMHAPLFWGGAVLILGIGFWDDKYGLDAKMKFFGQIVAAYLLLHAGSHLEITGLLSGEGGGYTQALYSIPFSIIWVVGIVNAVNLIDGLDGLATGIVGIAFLACAVLFGVNGHLGLMSFGIMVAGALSGFLPYNFKPASIFMGDSGSLFLGYLLAAYTLQDTLHPDPLLALIVPVVLLGIPVLDTGTAIVRRLVSHRSVFAPDKNHIHHRLVHRGSEKSAVLMLYVVGAWFGSTAILMGVLPAAWGGAIAGVTAAIALVWVWRLGCLHPILPDPQSDGERMSAPELLVWDEESGDGSKRMTSPEDKSASEDVLV